METITRLVGYQWIKAEETVNKDTQTLGGTKGFSLKPAAVNKYYLIAEYRSIFLRHLKDIFHLSASTAQHNDLQQSRISGDESDLKSLIALIEESWINPFQGAMHQSSIVYPLANLQHLTSKMTF